MRKLFLSLSVAAFSLNASAQTISTFEALSLPKLDTAYINYSAPGTDVGFSNGLAYFPCVYDTASGFGYWSYGFAYSNMRDTVTSGYTNQYAAKAGSGFASSEKYAVAYGNGNIVRLEDSAKNKRVYGMYITNNTYAYNSMRDGDSYAKKFKTSDSDWFRLDVFAYRGDTLSKDSVSFYLADFRNTDSSKNYIVNDWQWVNLLPLGKVDSLMFRLKSSDNGTFGMNTPAYFCIDNFITNETMLSIAKSNEAAGFKLYPNPANDVLFIESATNKMGNIFITDFLGRIVLSLQSVDRKETINTAVFAAGVYIINIENEGQIFSSKFVKQ